MSDRRFGPMRALRSGPLKGGMKQEAAFRAGAFFLAINGNLAARAWCEGNDIAIQRAQAEGTNSAGGALVPSSILAEIITLRELRGAFRAAARVVPLPSDSSTVPRRTGGLTAYFTSEGSAITESQGAWDNVGLTAKKIAALTRSSSELDEDSAIDLGTWFVSELAYAFASKEDDCGFNGDGTSTYSGIRGVTKLLVDANHTAGKVAAASGHNTYLTLDVTDLTNLIGTLPGYAMADARWFVSQLGFATTFCRLAGATGGIQIDQDDVMYFMGFPVQLTQVLPQVTSAQTGSVMLAFGDLSLAAMLGETKGVTVMRSDERYIELDQVGWLGTERVDINVHDLGDNTNAGPVVGLVGTA